MTKEQYQQARDYVKDIELLDSIIYSHNKIHLVKFVTPNGCDKTGSSDVFLNDFNKWVEEEKTKLSVLLEKL